MMRDVLRATALGIGGLVLGCLVVAVVVSRWTELSMHWLNGTMVGPIAGLIFGAKRARLDAELVQRLRKLLAPIAALLCGIGNHLAFVITARTWYGSELGSAERGFIYQVFHPEALPAFSVGGTEEPWFVFTGIGIVVGGIVFWWLSGSELPSHQVQGPVVD